MRTQYIAPPVGGWNASQPLDLMQPTDAARLINLIPRETSLDFRKGSEKLTTSALATEVETLATHRAEDGTQTLVACADGKIYTVDTTTGAATQKSASKTNNKWQTVNFNNLLLMVNGADAPQQFNGTTVANYTAAITGATPADLVGVVVFKGRCIYWENNAAKFWYAEAGSYGGLLQAFGLNLTTQKGGYVVECCTWTRDSGDGVDDLFVVIMSTGETLVYSGSDPKTDFALIGRFNLGAPISIRGSTNLASDRIIITEDGFVNLSTALQVGRASEKGNVSSKIINAAKRATNAWSGNYGWEVLYHDRESLLIVNVPRQIGATAANNVYEQYCMNTNTGAWTRFRGWDAITFTEVDGDLYMGGADGHIRKCFTGPSDDNNPINYLWMPAFNDCGARSNNKQLTFVTLQTNFVSKSNIAMAGLSDFELRAFGQAQIPATTPGTGTFWDEENWDSAYFSDEEIDSKDIYTYDMSVSTYGYSLGFKFKAQSNDQTAKIYSARLKYKMGRSI